MKIPLLRQLQLRGLKAQLSHEQRALEILQRRNARKQLRLHGKGVLQRTFSVVFKRVPGSPGKHRYFIYKRSVPAEIKAIELSLKEAYPQLNRKQRRHRARKHRYVFA